MEDEFWRTELLRDSWSWTEEWQAAPQGSLAMGSSANEAGDGPASPHSQLCAEAELRRAELMVAKRA